MDMKLEVVVVPVSDVDRAKDFYKRLGFREDIDFAGERRLPGGAADAARLGVLDHLRQGGHLRPAGLDRPPGPGGVRHRRGSRRAPLARRRGERCSTTPAVASAAASIAGTEARAPGPDPQRRSYASYASFSDPDGNVWLLQEIKERLPGRV